MYWFVILLAIDFSESKIVYRNAEEVCEAMSMKLGNNKYLFGENPSFGMFWNKKMNCNFEFCFVCLFLNSWCNFIFNDGNCIICTNAKVNIYIYY